MKTSAAASSYSEEWGEEATPRPKSSFQLFDRGKESESDREKNRKGNTLALRCLTHKAGVDRESLMSDCLVTGLVSTRIRQHLDSSHKGVCLCLCVVCVHHLFTWSSMKLLRYWSKVILLFLDICAKGQFTVNHPRAVSRAQPYVSEAVPCTGGKCCWVQGSEGDDWLWRHLK